MAATQIRNIPIERLPAVIIIHRVRAATEILSVIQGRDGCVDILPGCDKKLYGS